MPRAGAPGFSLFCILGLFAQAQTSHAALAAPEPYVLAEDGTTRLTLEQAGILKPDGRKWAIILGKALFWDVQAGSDNNACASCHFQAGADTRLKNQINPGFHDMTKGPSGDGFFGSERSDTGTVPLGYMPSGAKADSNYTLQPADLPLHRLLDEKNRNSPIVSTTNDRISSQGAFDGAFNRVRLLGLNDRCTEVDGSIFHAGNFAARQVEPRNTPSTINAVFYHRNFWDGRANNLFNGVGVFGMRDIKGDANKRLIVLDSANKPKLGYLQVENASLASQAVGPPLSEIEMSCSGRTFPELARKLFLTVPLLNQKIDRTDSVLGPYVSPTGKGLGLQHLYATLITKAFDKKYWQAPGLYKIQNGQLKPALLGGFTQMETNFSMFWGIAIMLYESSLVSDQSELDTLISSGRLLFRPNFAPGGGCSSPTGDVDPLLLRGCTIYARAAGGPPQPDGIRGGNCFICHNAVGGGVGRPTPPLLSQATFQQDENFGLLIEVGKNLGGNHRHDQGFMSIGLRPVFTDLLTGGTDPYGNPLSFVRQYQQYLLAGNDPSKVHDPVLMRAIDAGNVGGGGPVPINGPATTLGTDGASKSPVLRNIALTPPYFSWGGYPSLRQAMKLYNRGGNRRDITAANAALERIPGTACTSGDDSGTGDNGDNTYPMNGVTSCNSNVTATILPLGLLDCDPDASTGLPPAACITQGKDTTNDDLAALVVFMKALTDRRVQCDSAPFDHPELKILNGHTATDPNRDGKATDVTFTLPASGAAGYAPSSGYCIPNAGDLFAPGMQSRSGGAKVPLQ
jgi:cytochrome c peroxidase